MDLQTAAAALADTSLRDEAVEAIVAAGAYVIEPLLDHLVDPDSWIDRSGGIAVLRRFGPVGYRALIVQLAIAQTPDAVELCCQALGIAAASDTSDCALEICSEDPRVRADSAFVLGYRRRREYAPLLVPLLADPVQRVREEAIGAFGRLGRSAVPLLRRVRSSRVPERRNALAALTQIGWDTPEPRDLTVLARLMQAKIAADVPEPFVPQDGWYAIKTTDRAAVLDAFELSDPVAVTWSMGTDTWRCHDARHSRTAYAEHADCARMYVSPVLDGWTLVFGTSVAAGELDRHDHELDRLLDIDGDYTRDGREHQQRQARCAALSERFGHAHWYGQNYESGCDDWRGWCLAAHGQVLRYYYRDCNEHADPIRVGSGHTTETGLPVDSTAIEDRSDRNGLRQATIADTVTPMLIAGRSSVDPSRIGANTRTHGHDVLALTACGRRLGHRGAFSM
ncbi:HEAT repeat domain-containing protein [Nocardia sp. NBC_00565]|uniref:HEAT repeat domain-containing protein n=1 Tax=Nocardia sp. NBC_00565 TaxID=2975993 RepID=UPI002E7FF8A7|nr:HEAT repeat domain-containing protein [Nocardia sp. NBC_00565]WUC07647.1 HEAT repeat domain-containing protein [Nocardia sp. NBC_00565]